ncbi:hypothetical protein FOXB_15502 [Fusarium oxysporum f. sp. conglutinans Fo5176]|uniref:Protein kinase domain-containing protein n=1 Tax=Fusarium oxysporum (strain Fo5176) TaxID=660025 RepID=F9GA20_FUSOF|nr:hypothetical protein FOXB_15502 [Fusarium oxysporum f. sp. conglutinans Fo5176]
MANKVAAGAGAGAADLAAEVRRSSQAVWAEGVDHGDEREANRLWNDERRRVMLIDFDRATLRPNLKHNQLVKVSGKKRKRQGDELGNYNRKRGFRQYHLHGRHCGKNGINDAPFLAQMSRSFAESGLTSQ